MTCSELLRVTGVCRWALKLPKCRLRYDVRFSRAEISTLLEHLAEHFQYDDHNGVAPDRVLMRAYDKMQWRIQQNQERDYVVRQLQAQNKTAPEGEELGGAGAGGKLDKASSALRDLQQRPKLGRKKRGIYA